MRAKSYHPNLKEEAAILRAMRGEDRVPIVRQARAEPEFTDDKTTVTIDKAAKPMSSRDDVDALRELKLD